MFYNNYMILYKIEGNIGKIVSNLNTFISTNNKLTKLPNPDYNLSILIEKSKAVVDNFYGFYKIRDNIYIKKEPGIADYNIGYYGDERRAIIIYENESNRLMMLLKETYNLFKKHKINGFEDLDKITCSCKVVDVLEMLKEIKW